MARTSRRKRNVVEVDFTDVDLDGGGFRIEPGDYPLKVVEAVQEVSNNDNDMITWTFEGTKGKAKGKTFKMWTALVPEALWKLHSVLTALEVDIPESAFELDLDDMVDLECMGVIDDDTYQNKTRSKLMDVYSLEGGKDDSSDDDEDDAKPARGSRRKPAARRGRGKEDGDDDDDKKPARGGRKPARGGKRKPTKVSADEVKDMSEDELGDLIEKHELDVDLEEYKTLRRKAAAVVTALEEADLLED